MSKLRSIIGGSKILVVLFKLKRGDEISMFDYIRFVIQCTIYTTNSLLVGIHHESLFTRLEKKVL